MMPPEGDDPVMPPGDDESAKCECVGNSDSMGSEACSAFVTEFSCGEAPYGCSWKCDDGNGGDAGDEWTLPPTSNDGGEEADDFPMPPDGDDPAMPPDGDDQMMPEDDWGWADDDDD